MSFSGDVKEELVRVLPAEKHCRQAELSALLKFYAKIERTPTLRIVFPGENNYAQRKCFTLLNKTFNIRADISQSEEELKKTLSEDEAEEVLSKINPDDPMPFLDRECCKRAYLRGVFLATGFINDPLKAYHFECVSAEEEYTKLLTYLLSQFNINPKRSARKNKDVIYLKEAEGIIDVLSVLGAHKSMMDMANAKIVRNVRNKVNRRNNCDMANITKAVNAAAKQIEDILFLQSTVGLDALPDTLREIAVVRLEYPESSLTELGELLDPPVGKSGVNHRLRKISEFACKEREKK